MGTGGDRGIQKKGTGHLMDWYGNSMGPAYHKGVPCPWGSLKIPLIKVTKFKLVFFLCVFKCCFF